MEITGHGEIGRVVHNVPVLSTVTNHKFGGSKGCSDFRIFGLLKKHMAGKRYAADADVKQVVSPRLQTRVVYAKVRQILKCY
jgi:hypothetical protein